MDVADSKVPILLQLITFIIQAIAFAKFLEDTTYLSRLCLVLKSQTCFRSLVVRKNDVFKIHILVGTMQVLQLKSDNFYLLYQLFVVCIKCIKYINRVMSFLMRRRIVEGKERIEAGQRCLCCCTAHLLRFVKNNYRTIGSNDIDRLSVAEFFSAVIDNTCSLIVCSLANSIKCLGVDNHHANII